MDFRTLRADEIEVRVSVCKENGVSLLLYKDARCDMRILDETVGAENWQKEFYEHKGTLFCRVGININGTLHAKAEGMVICAPSWVWKADAGEPSNTSAQKGEASDAFKRACFNWGIGRELYTAPFVWVNNGYAAIKPGRNGKPACYDKFSVEKIIIEDGEIKALAIRNDSMGCRAFVWKKEQSNESA